MVIKRRKICRKTTNPIKEGRVLDIAPGWTFSLECKAHGTYTFDFSSLRSSGREDLAAHMRNALYSLRHQVVGKTLYEYWRALPVFWDFIDAMEGNGLRITQLKQIDRKVIDLFLSWQRQQVVTDKRRKNIGEPWSIGTQRANFKNLKSLLKNRQIYVPDSISPDLKFPTNPFPNANRIATTRREYSLSEQERIVAACNTDLERIYEGQWGETQGMLLTVHLIVLALGTGRNVQSLLDLRRDCLKPHPVEGREILVTIKRRGYSTHRTSLRAESEPREKATNTIPTSISGYIRSLLELTVPLLPSARPGDRDFILLYRTEDPNRRAGRVVRLTNTMLFTNLKKFVSLHNLRDDQGDLLVLNLARLRPTFGTNIYYRSGGDIIKTARALGHASIETASRHYVNIRSESEKNFSLTQAAMVGWITSADEKKAQQLASDRRIPLKDASQLLQGGYNTVVARCANPFRENGKICGKFMRCFNCPSMVVFEDDLYRLFSFYYKLLSEGHKIAPHHWGKTYGWVIQRINEQIAPQFDQVIVEEAKLRARENPHPAWSILKLSEEAE